jgi:hypothetical protein
MVVGSVACSTHWCISACSALIWACETELVAVAIIIVACHAYAVLVKCIELSKMGSIAIGAC